MWDEDTDSESYSLQEQQVSAWPGSGESRGTGLQAVYKRVGSENASDDEEEEAVYLDSQFDPDADYIRNFDVLGWHTEKRIGSVGASSSVIDEMVLNSEQVLTSMDLTPRDITQNLERMNSAIRMTSDPNRKARHIKSYELRKFDHDEDNIADKERAHFSLEDARNILNKPFARVHHYQMAIKFTNNIAAKEEIRTEYKRYCFSLKK